MLASCPVCGNRLTKSGLVAGEAICTRCPWASYDSPDVKYGDAVGEAKEYVPEGYTIIFEAPQRRGKTLGMVMAAVDAFNQGKRIFSNIQLGFPHTPLDFRELELEDGQSIYWNSQIVIDELNFFFDARRSMSKKNQKFGTYLLQQKKQGATLTGTTHNIDYLDVRLRQNYDYVFRPEVYPAFPHRPEMLRLTVENGPLQPLTHKTLKIPCRPFLGLYDTFAVYDPFAGDDEEPPKRKKPAPLPPAEPRVNLLG